MKTFSAALTISLLSLAITGCGQATNDNVSVTPLAEPPTEVAKSVSAPVVNKVTEVAQTLEVEVAKVVPPVVQEVIAEPVSIVVEPEPIAETAEVAAVPESAIVEVVEPPAPDYGPIVKRAIGGYDPVSYFSGTPQAGQDAWHVTHDNATYYFASEANRDAFYKDPARYAPAYGGWCAYAIGKTGDLVEVNPETFKIIDGELHLFYNKFLINTLKLWNGDEVELNAKAKTNWKDLVSQGTARPNTDQ